MALVVSTFVRRQCLYSNTNLEDDQKGLSNQNKVAPIFPYLVGVHTSKVANKLANGQAAHYPTLIVFQGRQSGQYGLTDLATTLNFHYVM